MMSDKSNRPVDTRLERHPVYQQLNERLRATLAERYQFGDRFLTEREISELFQVSRATANKALASLVSEGLLEFRRGIGTFVRRDTIDYDVRSLVSFTEKAKAAGKTPTTEVIEFRPVVAAEIDSPILTSLEVESDERLWEMQRLRLADGVPVILEHRYVVARHCPTLTRKELQGSLYKLWTERFGLAIVGADTIIRAILLRASEARVLQVPARSAALEVVSVGTLSDHQPLWWERTLYRGDQYEFQSRLGPIQSATPAQGRFRPE
jgi:GntR family transcriptional regulator